MADPKRITGPTPVGKGEYKPQATMTPEQQAEAAKKSKAAQARARAQASKRYQPQPNVEPERLGGGLTEAEMNVKAPGPPTVVRQQARPKADVRLKKVKPKKDLRAPQIGFQQRQKAKAKAQVDLKTGKPKPQRTLGQRYITDPMERAIGKIPASWRVSETGARAPRTMDERLGSISRTASKTFPGKATKEGGILDIPALAARGQGPALKSQKGTKAAAKRRAAMSLAEKQRKGLRVTGADVPGHGKGPVTPTGKGVEVLKKPGELGKGHLGSYRLKGTPAPVVEEKQEARVEKAPVTRRAPVTPKKKPTWWEKLKAGAAKAGKEFVKAGAELQQQSRVSKEPSGKYGTKEQKEKIRAGAKKALVPKKFKEKK